MGISLAIRQRMPLEASGLSGLAVAGAGGASGVASSSQCPPRAVMGSLAWSQRPPLPLLAILALPCPAGLALSQPLVLLPL